MSAALIVFAKPPVPGRVKTRLTPPLSPEDAARLYESFLQDALDQYQGLGVTLRLYLALDGSPPGRGIPAQHGDRFAQWGDIYTRWVGKNVFRQKGEGLGERMRQAFEETFAEGHRRVILIGTDHPTLPSAWIREGFSLLEGGDAVVLGPTGDGGFYLIGMNESFSQVFEGMTYSHEAVFEQTAARVASCGASLQMLPEWYDVDTFDDLKRLVADMRQESAGAMRTRAMLQRLSERYEGLV
ncbi:MAG: glycosyltransferase [Bacteroidetes bacterium SB0662_bin_6]|nr:glycosyltransferase [Bacteroidetes bacterium SB0668_bin_1]MYE03928.1 glycosyltransferase [Bacteroidetes bacterium SB0662_bin_6]